MIALVLRDIHQPPAPPWWPPAPGWWVVAALLLAVALAAFLWRRRRLRRRARWLRLVDDSLASAATPAERIARLSELLRRAARRRDPRADRLVGEAWLRFLDQGARTPLFAGELGELLREGAFRPEADAAQVARLEAAVRTRFLDWMERRR